MIATISKSVEFNVAEIKECKQKCGVLEKQAAALVKSSEDLERYKRRWNLRIRGLKELADEDARKEAIELLGNIAPHLAQKLEDVVDSVLLGKKEMEDTVK
ncbi:Undecaprenyl-diphosphatase [Labeo rohita]|uniref:Undecaprenyl-diphosphatase n=1 Tax=Labeo rohita TaxID=84645 RepID=A0ABQ8LA18_LABRO|nr:Undecaprenyl-diphosphatase [Labeo rohita]